MSKNKSLTGAYYTPPHIVDLIVEQTLGSLLDESSERVSDLRILDPSCGEGAFLTGACSCLQKKFPDNPDLQRLLHGSDIDETAIETAKLALPEANFKLGDSLLDPGLFENESFDVVIGNPPWLSLGGRFGIRAYSDAELERIRDRFGGNTYSPNLFEYFIRLGLDLTRPGGYFSYIVPDRLAFNKNFAGLRERMLTETEILLLVYGVRFPGITADTMIFVCRKGGSGCRNVNVLELDGRLECADLISEDKAKYNFQLQLPSPSLPQPPGFEFPHPEDDEASRLDSVPGRVLLGEAFDITSGFGGKASLISDKRLSNLQIPVLRGSGIVPYRVIKRHWFDFRRENLTGRTFDTAKLGATPKILIRKTGDRLIAAFDESDAYPEQSLYFLYNKRTDLDWRFILGLLNSAPVHRFYRARCLTNRRTIAHAKKQDLERIPIPPLDLTNPEHREAHDRIAALADKINPSAQQEIDRIVGNLFGLE